MLRALFEQILRRILRLVPLLDTDRDDAGFDSHTFPERVGTLAPDVCYRRREFVVDRPI